MVARSSTREGQVHVAVAVAVKVQVKSGSKSTRAVAYGPVGEQVKAPAVWGQWLSGDTAAAPR